MDFLDPKAKKKRNRRLMLGYFLVAILIITSSIILVYQAYGFNIDRKTGQVIQNGLVYIDSAPDDAALYLNGELHEDRTNARMTLPAGTYDILIKKDGYRDWTRTVTVNGGSVERITYPMLVLKELQGTEIDSIGETKPRAATQSPDRRWLLLSNGTSLLSYTEYDLNSVAADETEPVQREIAFPSGLLKAPDGNETFEVVEWSTDNKNFLVRHVYGTGSEYIIFNRDDPEASVNINNLLGVNPDSVSLRDKRPGEWYIYTKNGGVLQTANADKEIENVASNVTAYKTHDSTVILYAVKSSDKITTVYLRQNNKTYNLRTVAAGAVTLNIARYDDAWYAAVGSDGDKRTYIYKNPVTTLDASEGLKPTPAAVLKTTENINDVVFSTNTRFVMAQNGQNIGIYDAEKSDTYNFTLANPIDTGVKVAWMDGHRLQYTSGGQEIIVDFDGSNSQKLVKTLGSDTVFFDRDYTVIYSLNRQTENSQSIGLIHTSLRANSDK